MGSRDRFAPAWIKLDLCGLACGLFLAATTFAPLAQAQAPAASAASRPLNVILVLRDQTRFELPSAAGYSTPALDRLAQQGITFRNHYIASAMCTPSRAAFYSGHPPQVNGVFDQMETGCVPNLRKDQPNMGSMMKKLGYQTAFFGKWEMEADILPPKPTVNYSEALQPYGFDIYQPDGDKPGAPDQGYDTDAYTASEGVRWLRGNVPKLRESGQPFFLVMSYLNPHDIMYADANVPGTPQVQKAVVNGVLTAPPRIRSTASAGTPLPHRRYRNRCRRRACPRRWPNTTPAGRGPWAPFPSNRPDMWQVFNDYYLNMIRDTDLSLQQLLGRPRRVEPLGQDGRDLHRGSRRDGGRSRRHPGQGPHGL